MNEGQPNIKQSATIVAAGLGVGIFIFRHRHSILRKLINIPNRWTRRKIAVVEKVEDCHQIVDVLKRHCKSYGILGFDCEWVTVSGVRRPVALLQLCSNQGFCVLFRLSSMKQIPSDLRELLQNENIIKVGVGPQDDAHKLVQDYDVHVVNTLDLRFLSAKTGVRNEGLARMSQRYLNITLNKNWRIACSDWEAPNLSLKQLNYAANDALVAIEIFKKLVDTIQPKTLWNIFGNDYKKMMNDIEPYLDVKYNMNYSEITNNDDKLLKAQLNLNDKKQKRSYITLSKPPYDNTILQAPDGEVLSAIDRRKAMWYINQNLGYIVTNEPFTVRLNFEPAGRAIGEEGRFYQTPKENQCVVCGKQDVFLKKNVVPKEYSQHFPLEIKSHASHDVLLLCPDCHQMSNMTDLKLRQQLAETCNAPYVHSDSAIKSIEVPELKKLRSAGRALLKNCDRIPLERKQILEKIILDFYQEDALTEILIDEAANVNCNIDNKNYICHGSKVVETYQNMHGGAFELQKLWREHFVKSMKPRYLPALWNINHIRKPNNTPRDG